MTQNNRADIHAPARDRIDEDARQTLVLLQGDRQTVNMVLVALTDGVELEVWADGTLRRRSRFLRDSEARKYSERLAARLERRGYRKERERQTERERASDVR